MRFCGKTFLVFVAVSVLAVSAIAQTGVERSRAAAITPEKLSSSFAEVAKSVESAVVNIDTRSKSSEIGIKDNSGGKADGIDEMLRRQERRQSVAVGSGFIFDKSGFIVTNSHVVEDAARIFVQLPGGEEFVATLVGIDEETDLAVLKIDAGRELPVLRFADSETSRVGDWVLAFGSPFGLANTVTAGIISQVKRETPGTPLRPFQKFIQTDAAINRGNSGGPLVNMNGEVIGINSQIATSTGDSNGIGFALPSNEAARVLRQIVEYGKVRRGYLGVNMDSVKAEFAKVYGLDEARGAVITNISDKRSAAAVAGLLAGDIILEVDGKRIADAQDLIEKVAASAPDQTVEMTIIREAGAKLERMSLPVKLGERPTVTKQLPNSERRVLPVDGRTEPLNPFGLTMSELTPTIAAAYKIEGQKGVVVKTISPTSFIADVRAANGDDALREGDVIVRVNRVPVTDLKTFNDVAGKLKKGDAVVLNVLSVNAARVSVPKIVQFTVR
ncbi:MAG: trypsin-like peptidase domain-containing protein [Acidobacteria bacterium]|nr:trypsin-like peptidase domain-containing protein [Acidobacteriota bacterium]